MRLKHRLALLMLLCAASPIALIGWSAVRIASRSAIAAAEEAARSEAGTAAGRLGAEVDQVRLLVRLFARRSFDWGALSPGDLLAAEKLLYGLDDRIVAVSILHADGRAGAPSYYRRPGEPGSRRPLGPAELAAHAGQIPLAEALAAGEAVGAIYRHGSGGVRVAVAAASEGGDDEQRRVVVAELGLDELVADKLPGVRLFDAEGRLAVGPAGSLRPERARPSSWGGTVALRTGASLGSFAVVPGLGWGVGTERPLEAIVAPARRLATSIALWAVGFALAALLAGLLASRAISRPLEALAGAARDFGAGRLERRVEPGGVGEVQQVAEAFNGMADELSRSQSELVRYNAELEAMVAARTAELREAIDQLLVANRLAAIGQLGAGVAHEINNPLTYLVGALQLLPAAEPGKQGELAARCLASARRIQEVVGSLLLVSQPGGTAERSAVDVNAIIEGALRLVEGRLAQHRIEIRRDLGLRLPRLLGDPAQLVQALVEILDNAPDAMPDGGTLTIETRGAIGDKVLVVRISDTGRGVAPEHLDRLFDPFFTTAAHKGRKGMGLSLSYRIVKDHGGSIHPDSDDTGTRFVLRLPALPRALSLA